MAAVQRGFVPLGHLVAGGVPALGHRTQQVQRGGGSLVGLGDASGVGAAGVGFKLGQVDDVSPEAGEADLVQGLVTG